MAVLATNDQWMVAKDLLLQLLKDMGLDTVLQSNFVNNYLGGYCDFGQAAHWYGDDISTNSMESNHKYTKIYIPSMEQQHGEKGLLATIGAISARVQEISQKQYHHEPVHVRDYWQSLAVIAEKNAVDYNYATSVFFNHSDRGSLIDKTQIPSFMNSNSNITVYIPTQKMHECIFDLTRSTLAASESDDRCH